MNYNEFGTEDFIKDEFFIKWINEPCNETTTFWTSWIEKNPDKKATIEEARHFVENVIFDIAPAPEALADEMYATIQSSITNISTTITRPETDKTKSSTTKVVNLWMKKLAAAVVIGVMALGAAYLYYPWEVSYETAFGETKTIELPDGSVVTLHGNSKLETRGHWSKNAVREMSLVGEGIFEIAPNPKRGSKKCIVHTPNGSFVEVLGTTFTINTWEKEVDVVLSEGKVNFVVPNATTNLTSESTLVPGEKITLTKDSKLVKEKNVNTEVYTSWKNRKLTFDKTPVSEIVNLLENAYGFEVLVNEEEILTKQISGKFKDEISALLTSLKVIHGLKIEQLKDKQILIDK